MSVRCFTAVLLPDNVRHALAVAMRERDAAMRAAGIASPRWEREENLHCTLNFFGNVEESLIDPFLAAARSSLTGIGPLNLTIADFGMFPETRAPRVLWVGMQEHDGHLHDIYARLVECAEGVGMHPDTGHAFHPHITIGRWKDAHPVRRDAVTALLPAQLFGAVQIASIALMRSVTGPGGSVYSVVGIVEL